MKIEAPQIIYLSVCVATLIAYRYLNGNTRIIKFNDHLINIVVDLVLLYWGGFFG